MTELQQRIRAQDRAIAHASTPYLRQIELEQKGRYIHELRRQAALGIPAARKAAAEFRSWRGW